MFTITNTNFVSINAELAATVAYLRNENFNATREGFTVLTEAEIKDNHFIFERVAKDAWKSYKDETNETNKVELLAHIANYFVVSAIDTHRNEEDGEAVVIYHMRNKENLVQIINTYKEAETLPAVKLIERVEGNVYYTFSGIIDLDNCTLTSLIPLEALEFTLNTGYETLDIANELVKDTPEVFEFIEKNWAV